MPQELYTAQQVADLLGLHVKTVRGYIRDGRLRAVRIGKQYKVARPDLEVFTGTPVAAAAPTGHRRVEVTAIVEIDAIGRSEMSRLGTLVSAAATAGAHQGEPLRAEAVYDEPRNILKIILIGGPTRTAELLAVITQLLQDTA